MQDHQGWVKVHRKILDNPLFKNPKLFTLWMYLLIRANHSQAKTMIGNEVIVLKRGQFLTGRKSLSEALDIPESTLERLLKVLESEHQIEQQKKTKYRLISITNYELYQGDGQQVDNKRTTSGQQVDTDKNDKNNDNDKKQYIIPYQLIADEYNRFADTTNNPTITTLTNKRKALIKKAWLLDTINTNEKLRSDNLDYWVRLFDHASKSTFLNGNAERNNEHANWRPNFEFIFRESTHLGIREGNY